MAIRIRAALHTGIRDAGCREERWDQYERGEVYEEIIGSSGKL